MHLLAAVLLALSVPSETPIRDSIDRIAAAVVADERVGRVEGFESSGVQKPEREKFFGARNLLLGAAMFGSTVADVETSYACFGATRTDYTPLPNGDVFVQTWTCHEGNRHRRKDFEHGRMRVYPVNIGVNGALWAGSHFLRRSDHKTLRLLGWTVPVVVTVIQSRQAFLNARITADIKRGRP